MSFFIDTDIGSDVDDAVALLYAFSQFHAENPNGPRDANAGKANTMGGITTGIKSEEAKYHFLEALKCICKKSLS